MFYVNPPVKIKQADLLKLLVLKRFHSTALLPGLLDNPDDKRGAIL